MKLIYQEMLIMAVMENWQLQQTKLATKVRDWYQQLGDIHSFLEGVNIKKKDIRKDLLKEEVSIRRNYISNVYDQYLLSYSESMIISERKWTTRRMSKKELNSSLKKILNFKFMRKRIPVTFLSSIPCFTRDKMHGSEKRDKNNLTKITSRPWSTKEIR